MLSAAAMAPTVTRSSLEVMLDSIRLRDEKPKDAPPALPTRPVSRGRLPSSRRSLPRIGNNGPEYVLKVSEKKGAKNGGVAPEGDNAEDSVYAKMPELASYEDDHLQEKVAAVENTELETLQGISEVHKCFHGLQARLYGQEHKKEVTTLQSFIRGWLVRKQYEVLQSLKCQKLNQAVVNKKDSVTEYQSMHNQLMHLQSEVQKAQRALREKEEENITLQQQLQQYEKKLQSMEETWQEKVISLQDSEKEKLGLNKPTIEEIQRKVVSAEAALKQREEENTTLHQQLQQYETRRMEYEVKMKSMEEMWQKQMTSLQLSLAAARKSITSDNTASQNGRSDSSMIPRSSDFEDKPDETHRCGATPAKQQHKPDVGILRNSDGNTNAVSFLAKEFEQEKKLFEDNVAALSQNSSTNEDEELRKLKVRFATWKKDYKVRLQAAKMTLRKHHNSGSGKSGRSWWCSRAS